MICVRCGKDASVSLPTDIGQQCNRCFVEYIEPQPVGNFSDAVREDARAELDKKALSRRGTAPADRSRAGSSISPAKDDVGSFDRDPNEGKPRAGYFDGGIQYVPDDESYW